MKLPPLTLSWYLVRQFMWQILMVLAVMAVLILIVDFVELMRRAANREGVGVTVLIELAFLKLPGMLQRIIPFAIMIGSILALSRLTRTQELIIARASGVSVWQFLAPGVGLAALIGVLFLTVINPMTAAMLSRYEQIEGRLLKGRASMLAVSSSGLWLRQHDTVNDASGKQRTVETIVHALRVSPQEMRLFDVIIFRFNEEDRFIQRIDAKTALLEPERWLIQDALVTAPDQTAQRFPSLQIPTNLTFNQIQDSFSSPETLSFWELPKFITMLEEAGFSAQRHKLYWHSMLSLPFFLCAMVLVSAIFALKPHRMGGTGRLFGLGVLCGFLVYFSTDLINALALSGTLPVALAAWSTTIMASIAGVAALLHYEDG